jgi:signal transduction histidine kinase
MTATDATTARPRRDRAILAGAVAAVVLTSGLVAFTVLKAERDGSAALERLQRAQVEALASSMNTRIDSAFKSFAGIAGQPWSLQPGNAADQQGLERFTTSASRTGFFLVDDTGQITAGTLLQPGHGIGTRVSRPELDGVLSGSAAVLPVAPGVTTALPTIALAFPLKSDTGAVRGALIAEVDVSTQSDFNQEVAKLSTGKTGAFSYIDDRGVVVASSDATLLGQPLAEPLIDKGTGLHRGNGEVVVVENVPSARWRTVFRQDEHEFDGSLTGPLHSALLLILLASALAAAVGFVALARRLRAAREEQRRLQEVSAVREEFISIVSHELRTPVAGLLGFLQTTLDHWDGMADPERRRAVGRSLSSARRLHALTRDVLDTSTMESGGLSYSFATVDLRDEVSSAVLAAQDVLPDRVLRLTLPDEPTWVRCDRERITQVMTNLLDNAVKSAPTGALDITVTRQGREAVVSVTDQGPGMSETELARVFDKFVRGRTSTPAGTGLGLYICKQVVDAHGGEIYASSQEGRGATVTFTLPLVDAPVSSAGL